MELNQCVFLILFFKKLDISMGFVHELIQTNEINKQIFGIELISCLAEKYPITKCLELSKLALSKSHDYGINGKLCSTSENSKMAVKSMIIPITKIGKTFSILKLDCIQVLQELKLTFKNDFEICSLIDKNLVL
jgi:hypothetical protein